MNEAPSAESDAACNCFEYGGRSMCPLHSLAATGERGGCCCDLLTARLLECPAHPSVTPPAEPEETS